MPFKFIIRLLFLLCPVMCYGQKSTGELLNFRALNEDRGLPSNYIRCFERDSSGFMWIGTSNGLVRYDGSQVIVFQNEPDNPNSLSGNSISALELEGDSILWVGTFRNGLNKLNLKTKNFTRFVPAQNQPYSIPSREVYALKQDKNGDLWVGYNRDGFGRFNRKTSTFEQIKITSLETSYLNRQNNVIKNFIIDKADPNKIWIISLGSLIEFNIETNELVRHNPYGDNQSAIKIRLLGMNYGIQASDGKIYIACNRFGIWAYNPSNNSWKNYNEEHVDFKNRNENTFNLIEEMDSKTFWLSSKSRGLYTLNAETGDILPFKEYGDKGSQRSLPENINAWRLKSPEGYWFGAEKGVQLFNKQGNQFDIYKYQPKAEWLKGRANISTIYPLNEDEIYFGGYAGEGIHRYNFRTREKVLISPPNPIEKSEKRMFSSRDFLRKNDTILLVLADNALYELNLKTEKLTAVDTGLKFGIDYFVFNRILKHSDGSYYISTRYSGVYILDSSFRYQQQLKTTLQKPSRSLVSSSYINEICEDPEGRVWIGTEDGFSTYDPNENNYVNFDYNSRRDSIPVLKTLYRIALAPDSSLWFVDAYEHGVFLDYPYKWPYEFKPVITGNESKKDRINNFLFTTSGKKVISTESGLSISDRDGNFRLFTDKEGLPKIVPLAPIEEMADGRIVMASRNELISFYPDSLYYSPKQNRLHLSSITVFDKMLDARMDSIMHCGLVLNYLQNFFTLNLGLLNFDNPDEYRLSYRLKGFSDEWSTAQGKSAVFTNVPGGKFTFQARLIDKNNHIVQSTLQLPIEMVPPVWQRWWFRFLLIAASVGIVLSIIVVRFRTIRRKAAFARELATMELVSLRSQMNPHFIFNSLNSIRHQIITEKNEEAEKYLVKFSRLVRWILENSESHYISLKDELMALSLYLELEAKRFEDKFRYQLNVDPDIEPANVEVPGIIIQPFAENAIWHGLMQKKEAGTVIIDVKKTDSNLIIIITDDGIGREKAREIKSKTGQNQNSMGLKITTARLNVIQKLYNISCSAHIEDLQDENGKAAGTRVTVTLPLIHNFTNDQ